jgi:hypothetical protein
MSADRLLWPSDPSSAFWGSCDLTWHVIDVDPPFPWQMTCTGVLGPCRFPVLAVLEGGWEARWIGTCCPAQDQECLGRVWSLLRIQAPEAGSPHYTRHLQSADLSPRDFVWSLILLALESCFPPRQHCLQSVGWKNWACKWLLTASDTEMQMDHCRGSPLPVNEASFQICGLTNVTKVVLLRNLRSTSIAQAAEHLSSKCVAQSSNSSTTKKKEKEKQRILSNSEHGVTKWALFLENFLWQREWSLSGWHIFSLISADVCGDIVTHCGTGVQGEIWRLGCAEGHGSGGLKVSAPYPVLVGGWNPLGSHALGSCPLGRVLRYHSPLSGATILRARSRDLKFKTNRTSTKQKSEAEVRKRQGQGNTEPLRGWGKGRQEPVWSHQNHHSVASGVLPQPFLMAPEESSLQRLVFCEFFSEKITF